MSGAGEQSLSSWKRWWMQLQEWDRGGRAELRRCGTVTDVVFVPAFHRLLKMLGSRLSEHDTQAVAVIAGILAHVEQDSSPTTSMAILMVGTTGTSARVSETRFRHVLQADQGDELLREMIRIVRLVDRRAPIDSLGRDLMRWNDDVRRRWALDYYQARTEPAPRA